MLTKINLSPFKEIIADKFELICQNNPSYKLELSASGELIIMSPTGGETGKQNVELATDIVIWNRQYKQGVVFDSSTCFRLPNGGDRSPDVSWVKLERWETLTLEERKKFPKLAPDFVIELLSPTDKLKETQEKMLEYMAAGVRLGWLINPQTKTVEIYRQGREKEVIQNPTYLSGEDVLSELVIELAKIW